jgi:hypothetical protein
VAQDFMPAEDDRRMSELLALQRENALGESEHKRGTDVDIV